MDTNTIVMLVIFVIFGIIILISQGFHNVVAGFIKGFTTLKNVWLLLILALGIAGFLQVLIPPNLISQYLGAESGFKGYLIGWIVGALTPGAPYVVLPIAASLLKSGSAIGPIMTMIFSASIGVALTRLPYEIAFVDWKFAILRILSSVLFPLGGGLLAMLLNKWLHFFAVK